jgi:hypothetical protein
MPSASEIPATVVTRAELFWLTVGNWFGGVSLLTLVPILLTPRLGSAAGLGVSYLLFFMAWQPLQRVAQRANGTRTAFIQMLGLVTTAAIAAYSLRELLVAWVRGAGA